MSDGPGPYNFKISQGQTVARTVFLRDGNDALVDFTGATARMQIRPNPGRAPILDLVSGSGLTLGGVAGTIEISITAAQTAALPAMTGVYDLEVYRITAAGVPTTDKIITGTFTIKQENTF